MPLELLGLFEVLCLLKVLRSLPVLELLASRAEKLIKDAESVTKTKVILKEIVT